MSVMKKIIVLGVHNSGSTVLCQMLHFLRVNFGALGGRGKYGLSYEFHGAGTTMAKYLRFGRPLDWNRIAECKTELTDSVLEFFDRWSPMTSAVKHPFLCAGMTVFDDSVIRELTFVNCNRPLDHATSGAKLAYPKVAEHMAEYQADLHRGKGLILDRARQLGCPIFDWNYDAMTQSSQAMLHDIHTFLGTNAPDIYVEKALSLYDASMQHFGNDALSL